MNKPVTFSTLFFLALAVVGCDGAGSSTLERRAVPLYVLGVEDFSPGEGAGFGQDRFPEIVFGEPDGKGPSAGGTDVVSLGAGGVITVSFGEAFIIDGPGPDFAVYENAFFVGGDPNKVFFELGEVSVSMDGEEWSTYPCNAASEGPSWPGCAGVTPTLPCKPNPEDQNRLDCGGDLFDLEELGLNAIRYIRIRDMSEAGSKPSAGFDLDAVAAFHWELGG